MAFMFTHELNVEKGFPVPYVIDKSAELDVATNPAATVFAGACAHKSPAASGKLRLGVPAYASGVAPMPIFLSQNGADFDVAIDSDATMGVSSAQNLVGHASADAAATSAVSLRPVLSGIVACAGYELSTTEYSGTPTTGQLLTSPAGSTTGGVSATIGKLAWVTATPAANTIIVGVVSDGVGTSDHVGGPSRLKFWPTFNVVGL